MFLHNGELYTIEPAAKHWQNLSPSQKAELMVHQNKLIAYRLSDLPNTAAVHRVRRLTTEAGATRCTSYRHQQMYMGVATDAGFTSKHGGKDKTLADVIALFNAVNAVYDEQLNIHITLKNFVIKERAGGELWNVDPNNGG